MRGFSKRMKPKRTSTYNARATPMTSRKCVLTPCTRPLIQLAPRAAHITRTGESATGVRAGWRVALGRLRERRSIERGPVEDVALARLDLVEPVAVEDLAQDHDAADDDRRTLGLERRHFAALRERERGEPLEDALDAGTRDATAVDLLAVVRVEPEVERGDGRDRARYADGATRLERRFRPSSGRGARVELPARRRIGSEEALGEAHGADVEARPLVAEHELRRAAADVDDEGCTVERSPGGDPAQREPRLLVTRQLARREPVAPLDLAEERLAVLRVPHRARRHQQRALGAEGLRLAAGVGHKVPHAPDRKRGQAPTLVDALTEPRDRRAPDDLVDPSVVHVRDEQPRRVRPEVDRSDAHYFPRRSRIRSRGTAIAKTPEGGRVAAATERHSIVTCAGRPRAARTTACGRARGRARGSRAARWSAEVGRGSAPAARSRAARETPSRRRARRSPRSSHRART